MRRSGAVSITQPQRPRAPPGPTYKDEDPPYPSVGALRLLHIAAAALHAAWVALALSCLTDTVISTPVWFQRITYATGSDPGFIQRGPRETAFTFYNMRVLLGFVGVTAVFHVFYASLVGAGAYGNMWRWIEYATTATMLTVNAAVGVGVSSLDSVLCLIALSVIMQSTGLGLDLIRGSNARGIRELLLGIGFIVCAFLVVVLSWNSSMASGVMVNTKRVAAVYGIYYFSFGINGTLRAYDVGLWAGEAWTEALYVILSLSSKTSLFWMSFGGIRQQVERLRPNDPVNGVNWADIQMYAAYVPGALAILTIAALAASAPRRQTTVCQTTGAIISLW